MAHLAKRWLKMVVFQTKLLIEVLVVQMVFFFAKVTISMGQRSWLICLIYIEEKVPHSTLPETNVAPEN